MTIIVSTINLNSFGSSITGYIPLQLAIANWMGRDADVNITTRIPDFIEMAHSRIMYGSKGQMESEPLRVRKMEVVTTITCTQGNELIALPVGYLGMKRLKLQSSPNVSLKYMAPDAMDSEFPDSSYTGKPSNYTIEGENIRLSPIPDSAYTIEILYYKQLDDIALYNTNWLLQASPQAYLYGALIEACPFIGDTQNAAGWYGSFVAIINGLNSQDSQDRHGSTAMAIRTDAR